jgi:hypothetical protein
MAAIISATTGLWSATATWVGGVVPGEFDTVTIAVGHTVTLDGTRIVGNDATPGLTLNGRLKASRTVNSLLTIKGTVANSATGEWDWGIEGDTIPASVTAGVRVNYSGTMANNKYIVGLGTTTRMNLIGMRGVDKRRHTKTTTAVTGGSTVTFTVSDATGWAVGDWLILSAETNGISSTLIENRQISAISGNDVTVSTVWTNSRAAGAVVANVWSNVYIEHFNATNFSGFTITPRTGMPANSVDIKNVSFHGLGTDGTFGSQSAFTVLTAPYFANSTAVFRDGVISRLAVSNIRRDGSTQTVVSGSGLGIGVFNSSVEFEFLECVVAYRGVTLTNQLGLRGASSSEGAGFRSCCVLNVPSAYISNASDGGSGIVLTDFVVRNATTPVIIQPGTALVVNGGDFDRYNRFTILGTGDITVNNANLGVNNAGAVTNSVGGLALVRCTLTNCTVGSMALSTSAFVTAPANPLAEFAFVNKNSDVTVQEIQTARGFISRDNAVSLRGTSAIKFWPQAAGRAHGRTYLLAGASAGQTVMVRGSLRFDATYGTATPPSITLSGQGSTPAAFTAPATANAWHDFALTVTPSSTGDLELTVTGTSTATTGAYWLDGVILPPFVVAARHYGYLYNNAIFQTVDPVITEADASIVAAYTGIAINHTTDTITLTANRTAAQLYDYLKYDLSITANLAEPDYVSGTLASLNIGAYNLVINGCTFTSGGTLTTTGTITLGAGGNFVGTRVDSSGSISSAIATVTDLVAGSRVQIYNVTTATEIANEIVASTSWVLDYYNESQFTAGDQIRIRIARLGYLPQTLLAVATTSGFSVPASQQTDVIYVTNGINGSTVTEFTPDYPNVQMDVSDPDGVTTVQRIYAWLRYTETTLNGIDLWFDVVTPTDEVNYFIDAAKLNLKIDNTSASPVTISGGRIYRSDNTTIIAATSGSIQMDPDRVYSVTGIPTASQNAAATWSYALENTLSSGEMLRGITRTQLAKVNVNETTGDVTIYKLDGTTVFAQASTSPTGDRNAPTVDWN